MSADRVTEQIRSRVKEIPPVDAGHDYSHTERVAALSVKLIKEESSLLGLECSDDHLRAAELAALLHDCVPIAKDSPLRKESARLCAERAEQWLIELNFEPSHFIPEIVSAIKTHSYSAGLKPENLIGKVLQDADRLEALGALGLYRTIATGVSMGATLFDVTDPFAERRELNDRKFTIDHIPNKLLKLPAGFKTESARKEAERRAKFLVSFLEQLKTELIF